MAARIVDIYPLSPVQQGILLECLDDATPGLYCEQVICDIEGVLDLAAFEGAWQDVLARHGILRTAFVWEDVAEPLQGVWSMVTFSLGRQDWRKMPAGEQGSRLEVLLNADRRQGFSLLDAPLLRVTLIQLADAHWQFVWTFHHLLLDGWSVLLVLDELVNRYEARVEGHTGSLPPAPRYRDYIEWLRRQDLQAATFYWRKELERLTGASLLGRGHVPSGEAQSGPPHREAQTCLSSEVTAALQALARKHRLTLNSIIAGAWAILLARYTGSNAVTFAQVVSSRAADVPDIDRMVGPLINTLPAYIHVEADTPLIAWLQFLQAREVLRRQYDYLPLGTVQRCSTRPSGEPLFDSILIFENYPLACRCEAASTTWTVRVRPLQLTPYPLHLMVMPDQPFLLHITYDSRQFCEILIHSYLRQMAVLLESMASQPEWPLYRHSLQDPREQTQVVIEWNTTAQPYPLGEGLAQVFGAQVCRTPDAVAAAYGDRFITYRDLNRYANCLAWHLIVRGVGPEQLVALLAHRNLEFLIAVLAIFKAGGAYLPVEPSYPTEHLQRVLTQSRPLLCIASGELVRRVSEAGLPVLTLEDLAGRPGHMADPPVQGSKRQLAYVIYTSGSTGTPKGVMIEQQGMLNHLYAKVAELELDTHDIVAQTASQAFDISIWQFLAPLLVGGCVQLIERTNAEHPERLLDEVSRRGVSVLELVPAQLQPILEVIEMRAQQGQPVRLDALRCLMLTGEPLPSELCRQWRRHHPRIPLLNAYGPTECSDDVTHYVVQDQLGDREYSPVGRPLANTRIYVLDRDLQPVPIGMTGEVYVGGTGVGRGYRDDPARTAEAFLPDLYAPEPGHRFYRTADIGRHEPDGNLVLLGRLDTRVKILGHRIELAEIEAALSRHGDVRQSVVLAVGEGLDCHLVAYVVMRGGRTGSQRALQRLLRRSLPDYMVPTTFVFLSDFPLTTGGKVDRKALRTVDVRRQLGGVGTELPYALEQIIAGAWKEVLDRDDVGLTDNFFDIGGSSIRLFQLHAQLRRLTSVDIHLLDLFRYPTIKALAQHLAHDGRHETPREPRRLRPHHDAARALGERRLAFSRTEKSS
jgi:amino acid adenylation domain-containing protein